MLFKHMEDGAECNMLIDDAGTLLVICSKCKEVWADKLALAESPTSVKKVTYMVNAALEVNPSILMDVGIDTKSIATLRSKLQQ